MNTQLQKLFHWVILCAALSGVIVSFTAPSAIAWYFATPVPVGIDCRPATEWAMQRLRYAQGIAMAVGASVGFMLWLWRYKKSRQSGIANGTNGKHDCFTP